MQVLHRPARFVQQHIALADVHAAGEPNPAVSHEDFPVVVEVYGREPPGGKRREKSRDRQARPPQLADDRGQGITRARIVNQHAHLDATRQGTDQRSGELVPAAIVVKDVGCQRNGLGRFFDGSEHRGKGFIAVDERLHAVGGDQRPFGDAIHHVRQHPQMLRLEAVRLAHVVGNWLWTRIARLPADPQGEGVAPDAVDAQRQVEQRPHERQQPDESQPQRRGARIALVKHGVNRGKQGGQKAEAGGQVRPKLRQMIPPIHRCTAFMQREFKNRRKRRSRRVNEAEVFVALKIASQRCHS